MSDINISSTCHPVTPKVTPRRDVCPDQKIIKIIFQRNVCSKCVHAQTDILLSPSMLLIQDSMWNREYKWKTKVHISRTHTANKCDPREVSTKRKIACGFLRRKEPVKIDFTLTTFLRQSIVQKAFTYYF